MFFFFLVVVVVLPVLAAVLVVEAGTARVVAGVAGRGGGSTVGVSSVEVATLLVPESLCEAVFLPELARETGDEEGVGGGSAGDAPRGVGSGGAWSPVWVGGMASSGA